MTSEAKPSYPHRRYKALLPSLNSRWLLGLLLMAAIAGGAYIVYRAIAPTPKATSLVTATAQEKSLPITFTANGTIKPERTINVSPKTSGYLKQLLVKEGDRVQQGQILAYMDNSNLQGQLTQARAQLAQQEADLNKLLNGNRPEDIAQARAQLNEARSQLQQLETGNRPEDIAQADAQLNQAEVELRLAEDELQRNETLLKAGAISQQTVVQKRAARDAAQATVERDRAALKLQQRGTRSEEIAKARSQLEQRQQAFNLVNAGARPEDIAAARARVDAARGALETIQTQVNDTIIKAPFTGAVTKKYADPGSFVTPTTAGSSVEGAASNSILTLAATPLVVAYLDEANVGRVKIGQSVKISSDAYPNRPFQGKVSQIAQQATTTANVTSFEVKVALEPAAREALKIGMNVDTEFQVGELKNALLIPSAAIVRQKNGTGVYTLGTDNKPVFKPIKVGLTIGEQTEVKSGIGKQDSVLLSFPPGMEPKAQLRGPLGELTKGRNSGQNRSSPRNNNGSPPPQ
ncbi:biotin/lipoyl-binding protein [Oscillatoria sp. FACHB-1406]|uniref:HlyD family efflux transporter periplasmic adaptor subunit n=1 Tax=Oscillatoria sp. FACHB-1406 TaxID=2692846 RepID=UPI001686BAE3|nr:biotin/lipoyl-binding protein [Oscillatoria sp. FACHB-1406]MBD2580063.1 biotin/lipoyl-binding protein [Oscillatoria sp. FACHB-1406]